RQAGRLSGPGRRVHAGRARRGGFHLRRPRGAPAGFVRLPAEDRLRARPRRGRVLRCPRAPLAHGAGAMRRAVPLAVVGALGLSACAYFNALYNAKRLFAEAEAAAAKGQASVADASYSQAIEKAAKSLRKDPDGRWAD